MGCAGGTQTRCLSGGAWPPVKPRAARHARGSLSHLLAWQSSHSKALVQPINEDSEVRLLPALPERSQERPFVHLTEGDSRRHGEDKAGIGDEVTEGRRSKSRRA
ncbi:hypothetical protein NDU88_005636 [Pleurodeles waltl]|uniref:Uncharacterized protein n=1 Tax=Pleurodeles waltl TaxID=8319 RepID=A0AAV7QFF9_PLEWA|nr:hypothetical protein NDU88_005636 [Pleurodeles waltl]